MDTQTIITLLTIAVVLLSVMMIAVLTATVLVVLKIRRIAEQASRFTDNLASASEWLVPAKVMSEVVKLFRK